MTVQTMTRQSKEVLTLNDFVSAYVEHPGDYTWQEALEIANERDREAADQLRIDALEGV